MIGAIKSENIVIIGTSDVKISIVPMASMETRKRQNDLNFLTDCTPDHHFGMPPKTQSSALQS